jgi:hypothetical protein
MISVIGRGLVAPLVLLAILLVAAGAWWLIARRARARIGAPEDAADAADTMLAGFRTANAVLGADGRGALLVDADGRVAVARPRGRRVAVREIGWDAVRATPQGMVVEVRGLGRVLLAGVDALDVRRLAPGKRVVVRAE